MPVESTVQSVEKIQLLDIKKVPIGVYVGTWSGYEVDAKIDGELYVFKTTKGMRGVDIPCTICVDGVSISITT